jgi:hypothetical protein
MDPGACRVQRATAAAGRGEREEGAKGMQQDRAMCPGSISASAQHKTQTHLGGLLVSLVTVDEDGQDRHVVELVDGRQRGKGPRACSDDMSDNTGSGGRVAALLLC